MGQAISVQKVTLPVDMQANYIDPNNTRFYGLIFWGLDNKEKFHFIAYTSFGIAIYF